MADLLDEPEPLRDLLVGRLALGGLQLLAKLVRDGRHVHLVEELADRLGAGHRDERAAMLGDRLAVVVLGEDLLMLEVGVAREGDDVVLEVDDLLEVADLHPEQRAETARHRLEEPDVDDRGGQVDVAHALAADPRVGHLHAAAVADDALVLRSAVLAAGALVVALGAEDPLAEEAVPLGAVGAVVDGLGLLDLAEAPASDVVGACEGDLHRPVVVDAVVDVVVHGIRHSRGGVGQRKEDGAERGAGAIRAAPPAPADPSRARCSCRDP